MKKIKMDIPKWCWFFIYCVWKESFIIVTNAFSEKPIFEPQGEKILWYKLWKDQVWDLLVRVIQRKIWCVHIFFSNRKYIHMTDTGLVLTSCEPFSHRDHRVGHAGQEMYRPPIPRCIMYQSFKNCYYFTYFLMTTHQIWSLSSNWTSMLLWLEASLELHMEKCTMLNYNWQSKHRSFQ